MRLCRTFSTQPIIVIILFHALTRKDVRIFSACSHPFQLLVIWSWKRHARTYFLYCCCFSLYRGARRVSNPCGTIVALWTTKPHDVRGALLWHTFTMWLTWNSEQNLRPINMRTVVKHQSHERWRSVVTSLDLWELLLLKRPEHVGSAGNACSASHSSLDLLICDVLNNQPVTSVFDLTR